MNLFNNLQNNYGQNTEKIVRDLENTGKKDGPIPESPCILTPL